ncbi:primosomal protein DnaI [Liquorilactobacillus vini]|uniref:Primosomal protein DnaI n=2 Tax=Liquorilactobacillus vini TaxID=238015 RepID=A0A0R2CPS9_9LACO|nr:primosomal protein DnaI [Liquorilactobacillus vini]KRM89779.1 primosomal protein DnaI [Liquorilactobacillus vini DSM 20605]
MHDIGKQFENELDKHNWNKNYQQLIKTAFADPEVRALIAAHHDELTTADLKRSASKVYEFVTVKNQLKAGQTTLAPGYVPQLQVVDHSLEVSYVPGQQLQEQQKQAQLQQRMQLVNLPRALRRAQLANFEVAGRQAAAVAAVNFVKAYLDSPQTFHQGLYLSGSFGVGKTYLLAAIANSLAAEGYRSLLVHFPSFAVNLKNSIGTDRTRNLTEKLKNAPVLMIDDLGADQLSSWIRDDVLGIILQYRMQEQLVTFFSSNLSLKELQDGYLTINNRGEAEPLKAQRIMERIRYLAQEIRMVGRNRRNS